LLYGEVKIFRQKLENLLILHLINVTSDESCRLGVVIVRKIAFVFVLLVSSLCSSAFATNGPALVTVGAKGPVTVPVGGDGQTAFRMPSAIGFIENNSLDLNVFFAFIHTEFTNRFNDYEGNSAAPGATFGYVFAPGRPDFDAPAEEWAKYSPANKWTFHTGVFAEIAAGGETEVFSSAFPQGVETSTDLLFITVPLTVAYTPTEWLSVGGAFHFTYAMAAFDTLSSGAGPAILNGSPQIAGVPLPGSPTYADFLSLFSSGNATDPTTRIIGELEGFNLGGVVSMSIKPNRFFAIGLAYQFRSYSPDFESDGKVDATDTFSSALAGLSAPIQSLFVNTLPNRGSNGFVNDYDITVSGIHLPRRVRASLAIWPTDNLVIAFEAAWVEWHRALNEIKIFAENGQNADINFVVGSSSVNTGLTLGLRNQWIFSAYTAYSVSSDVTLRFGLNYGKSPFNPDRQGNSPGAAFVDANVLLGVGYWFNDHLEVSTLFEYGVRNEEMSDGSPDSLAAKFTSYVSEQFFLHIGISYKF
jgi:long-subunit fatty acid transport protein